jgi:hypothetical protein
VTHESNNKLLVRSGSGALIRLNDDDDLHIAQTAYAHKRVKVVQLLIFGEFCYCLIVV